MKDWLSYLVALMIFMPVMSFAQKWDDEVASTLNSPYDHLSARLHYVSYPLTSSTDTTTIKQILARELKLSAENTFHVKHVATSLTATHITFAQYVNGVEVLHAGAKVAVNKKQVLFRIIENCLPTYAGMQHLGGAFNATNQLAGAFTGVEVTQTKPVFVLHGETLSAGWYAQFLHDNNGNKEAAWLTNGNLVYISDLNRYMAGPDTTVTAKVFNPDPITPINKTYGGIYIDMNDANEAVLDPLRVSVEIRVNFDTGYFHLKSPYVEIREFSNPVNEVVKVSVPEFHFSRSHHGFEQTNAFYHISAYQNYLQSLGYSLVNYPIAVDAQGFNGADNSAFTPGTNPPRITFGEGGVDDGEDADVIVHEYGHAISHSAAPYTNTGVERQTLDEALGDYFAVSYTRNTFAFNNNWVFNWDGHNPFFSGRTVNNPSNFCYTTAVFSNIYKYTTLWNDAMFDIWDQLGKVYTDKLQIEAMYGYFQNMTFTQAAYMVLDADSALTGGGSNTWLIWEAFDKRCILDWTNLAETNQNTTQPYRLLNTMAMQANAINLHWQPETEAQAEVIDMQGRCVASAAITQGDNYIISANLPGGLYILHIHHNGAQYTEKLAISGH